MRRFLSPVLGFLLSFALALLSLSTLINGSATSPALMLSMLRRHAPSAATGLPDEDYPAMADMIARYLAGSEIPFQYILTATDGSETVCFNAREQQHMADCRALFVLCRGVQLFSGMMSALLALLLLLLRDTRRSSSGFLAGGGLVLACVLALLGWGIADFDGLFVRFHQLSFANHLWLLNPRTDMLIRLMPTSFFVQWGGVIGAVWLLFLALAEAVAAAAHRRSRHG